MMMDYTQGLTNNFAHIDPDHIYFLVDFNGK